MFNLFNSFLGSETPRTNNPPSLLNERKVEVNIVEEEKLLSDIKLQISIAKENIQKDVNNPNKDDEKILKFLKETLNETFTNSYYMIQKVNGLELSEEDKRDIEKQKDNLEELNKYCENIYEKYE
tara:strand:- start:1021 stop:1395 length:375 start_codon:yes stop_codon:yes gene_type:complete